jgi:hypothetical protein
MRVTAVVALGVVSLVGAGVATAATVGNDTGGTAAPAVSSAVAGPDAEPGTGVDADGAMGHAHPDPPAAMDAEGTELPPTESEAAHAHAHRRDYAAVWAAASAEEQADARALVEQVKAGTAKYADTDVAAADGYRPNPNSGPDASHWPSRAAARDGRVLDPARPESLMYWTASDGRKVLVGAVFKAFPSQQAPTPGGDLTMWHVHESTTTKCYPAEDDTCEGTKMLHVFFFDGVVDPFTENWAAAAGGRDAFVEAMHGLA